MMTEKQLSDYLKECDGLIEQVMQVFLNERSTTNHVATTAHYLFMECLAVQIRDHRMTADGIEFCAKKFCDGIMKHARQMQEVLREEERHDYVRDKAGAEAAANSEG